MTKRNIRRYLIAFVIGALVSCAVAWGIALSRGNLIGSAANMRMGVFEEPLSQLTVLEARTFGITQTSVLMEPKGDAPRFPEVRDALLHVPRLEEAPPLAPSLGPGGVQVDTTFGLPFRCLASRTVATPAAGAPPVMETMGWQLGRVDQPLLPIVPRLGLVCNAVVFGMLPLLGWDGWRRRRAAGRQARGLCPGCGYALTPRTPVCPECGGSLRSQRVEQ